MTQPESSLNRKGAAAGPPSAMEHCRAWLDWAATQVDLCLYGKTRPACNRLLESLTAALVPQTPPRAATEAAGEKPMSQKNGRRRRRSPIPRPRDATAHPRSGCLRLLHAHLGDANRAESGESWVRLREMQMGEFTMAEERALFSRLVAHEEKDWLEVTVHPDETVELFIPEAGLKQP